MKKFFIALMVLISVPMAQAKPVFVKILSVGMDFRDSRREITIESESWSHITFTGNYVSVPSYPTLAWQQFFKKIMPLIGKEIEVDMSRSEKVVQGSNHYCRTGGTHPDDVGCYDRDYRYKQVTHTFFLDGTSWKEVHNESI